MPSSKVSRCCLVPMCVQIDYLTSIGLKQDEICNMASISVVLLGLNPDTRLKPVVDYAKSRGVPDSSVADLVLRHPRIFEYKVSVQGLCGVLPGGLGLGSVCQTAITMLKDFEDGVFVVMSTVQPGACLQTIV